MNPPVLELGLLAGPGGGDQGTAELLRVPLLRSLTTLDLVRLRPIDPDGIEVGSCFGALFLVLFSSHRNTWRRENKKRRLWGTYLFSILNL
jgi:hypothetical protein